MGQCFKLSVVKAPETEEDKKFKEKIPYTSRVVSFMYVIVCFRSDLAYSVSIVSMLMSNLGKSH